MQLLYALNLAEADAGFVGVLYLLALYQELIMKFIQFIHSGHFYSAPSSPLLLRGAPDYSTDTVSEFHAEAPRQL